MSKRPPIVQELSHGKFLCQSVFRFFVDTWNWIVHAVPNLRGDYDNDPDNGHIHVDWSDTEHPTIHFLTNGLDLGDKNKAKHAYDINWDSGELVRRYMNIGGITAFDTHGKSVDIRDHYGFCAIEVRLTDPEEETAYGNVKFFPTLDELVDAQKDVNKFVKALYYLGPQRSEGEELKREDVIDLRDAPTSIIIETLLDSGGE